MAAKCGNEENCGHANTPGNPSPLGVGGIGAKSEALAEDLTDSNSCDIIII